MREVQAPRKSRVRTAAAELRQAFERVLEEETRSVWPDPKWQADPVGFARSVLGVDVWGKQRDVLESVRDNRSTTVRGGRQVGKDFLAAILAWWWFCSFASAKVMMIAPTEKQLNRVLWGHIRTLWQNHGRCVECKKLDPPPPRPCPHSATMVAKVSSRCQTGIMAPDDRQMFGMTAVSEGGLRGFGGPACFAIFDEAQDIRDDFHDTIVGGMASSHARELAIANPRKTRGWFYRSHHQDRAAYGGIFQISSLESPNIIERREIYPGAASIEWLEQRKLVWPEGSPMWLSDVLGEFVSAEQGQLFPMELIMGGDEDHPSAEERWSDTPAEGRLQVGVDVAGESNQGDETVFCLRRGSLCYGFFAKRSMRPEDIVHEAVRQLSSKRQPSDREAMKPVVVVDRDGETGAKCWNEFRAYEELHPEAFELRGFRGSERPKGPLGQIYQLNRDLLYGGLVAWFRDGGAIPCDLMLEAELLEMRWLDNESGKQILIRKDDLRERLKRSPDRADALALSTWGAVQAIAPRFVPEQAAPPPGPGRSHFDHEGTYEGGRFDIYSSKLI